MILVKSERAPQSLSTARPRTCAHSRMISDRVTEEEHEAGKVRCVECSEVIPDPYL
jgi:hypothetical protein